MSTLTMSSGRRADATAPAPGNTGETTVQRFGKRGAAPSADMAVQHPQGRDAVRGGGHRHAVRRLRDALRSQILHGDFPGGQIPGEAALMAAHGATRGIVREALALLRAEGLIARTQGVGTYTLGSTIAAPLTEMHGAVTPGGPLDTGARPRIIDRCVVAADATVARRLAVPAGTPCLRYEYVQLMADAPVAVATNYVLFPEAERLLAAPFEMHWYRLLEAAGLQVGTSEFVMGCVVADADIAALTGIAEGGPLLLVEQVIRDGTGRPWDLAFVYVRTDRFVFVSRSLWGNGPGA